MKVFADAFNTLLRKYKCIFFGFRKEFKLKKYEAKEFP